MGWGYYGDYPAYVPVAEKKAKALKHATQLAKKAGREPTPVLAIQSQKITKTFWGNSWGQNLEAYSDYANRLPRGRTYVRNGSVVDLQILEGSIKAIVAGSEPYTISINIEALSPAEWKAIKRECAGQIGSLVELLQGKLSRSVMEIVTRKGTGLFPRPKEIKMCCSCPDSAGLCKHLAAVMYGIGSRLDEQPELLFKLRKVDHLELIEDAGQAPISSSKATAARTIATGDLADMFGIEIAVPETVEVAAPAGSSKPTRKKPATARASTPKPPDQRSVSTTRTPATKSRKPTKTKEVSAVTETGTRPAPRKRPKSTARRPKSAGSSAGEVSATEASAAKRSSRKSPVAKSPAAKKRTARPTPRALARSK